MAHTPEKKAEAVADVIGNGLSYDKAAKKHGVGKATLIAWVEDTKTDRNRPVGNPETDRLPASVEARKQLFDDALFGFLLSTVKMLHVIAETCCDPDFIKEKPEGVNDLASTVFDRAERIMAVVRGDQPQPTG